jgi:hypothetical protein
MYRTVVAFNDDLGALLDGLCPYATHDGGCVVVAGGWKLRSSSNSVGGLRQDCGTEIGQTMIRRLKLHPDPISCLPGTIYLLQSRRIMSS